MELKDNAVKEKYHPDYGLPNDIRHDAVVMAALTTVKTAADHYNVSPNTLYRWRKDLKK
jgi:transposase-like protein